MRVVLFIAMLSFAAASALAQPPGKRGAGGGESESFKGPGQLAPHERGREAGREQMRSRERHERMRPEERDKLRQDIEEANRRMERRGRQ